MKYTNKHNFPDFVKQWLEFDEYDYDENAISATTLMKPARAYALGKKHKDELEMDLSDLIASRYGTAIHDSVEKINLLGCKQEERLKKAVMNRILTGKFDILKQIDHRWELIDVKSTSVWTFIYGSRDEDYIKQLSIYRWLAVQNQYDVMQKAKIWLIFTDWSQSKAKQESYPDTRIVIKEVDLWSDEKTLKYLGERITLFNNVERMEEKDMPDCTDKELWAKEDTWAIMKEGRKSAVKVCKSETEADEVMRALDEKHKTVHRPGKVARCKYCNVRKFCSQYKKLVSEGRCEDLDV